MLVLLLRWAESTHPGSQRGQAAVAPALAQSQVLRLRDFSQIAFIFFLS